MEFLMKGFAIAILGLMLIAFAVAAVEAGCGGLRGRVRENRSARRESRQSARQSSTYRESMTLRITSRGSMRGSMRGAAGGCGGELIAPPMMMQKKY
jgi:hypothetical protein